MSHLRTPEFDRIAQAFGWSRDPSEIGDDAAVLEGRQLLCCDALAEGVHFRLDWSTPMDVGWKAVTQNVSDILAMGGLPTKAVWSVGMGRNWDDSVFSGLAKGAKAACKTYGCEIVGGDTVRCAGPGFVSLSLLGKLQARRPWVRSGAQPGDLVALVGAPGVSAVGLLALSQGFSDHPALKPFVRRHLRPKLEFDTIAALFGKQIHAAIDLSDGLSSEAHHLACASGVAVVLDGRSLKVTPAFCRAAGILNQPYPEAWIHHGGEDHCLLFTAPASICADLPKGCKVVGAIEEGTGVWLKMDKRRQRMAPLGWKHN